VVAVRAEAAEAVRDLAAVVEAAVADSAAEEAAVAAVGATRRRSRR
jgi:hypothetical protein